MVTPLLSTDALDAGTLNARLNELQAAIDALRTGATATTPNITDFTAAQHNHTNGFSGGMLLPSAISSSGGTSGQTLTADGVGGWAWTTLFQVPSGVTVPFAGTVVPAGWLLCAGQAVSRTAYATLFATIGTTFGVGDGATTFNLPHLNGRTIVGLDNMNGTSANVIVDAWADVLGGTGGLSTHPLSISEMPAHTHTITQKTDYALGAGGGTWAATSQSPNTTFNSGSSGSGAAHNNIQPSMALPFIIKT